MTLSPGFFSLRYLPVPETVPPCGDRREEVGGAGGQGENEGSMKRRCQLAVPTPPMKMSTVPSVSLQICMRGQGGGAAKGGEGKRL